MATVQAFNSALVRARVDGEISRVAFTEGSKVRRGEVLVELDRRPLEAQLRAAGAQKAKDVAQLENARLDLARYEDLVAREATSRQTLDATRALVAQFKAAVASDDAQLDAARLQLSYATIRAPFDGRTGARLLDVGNMVHSGDASGLLTLTQIQPISVSFALPQNLLPELRQQQARSPLQVDAVAEDGHTVMESGRLTLIDNQVDAATGTVRCKATFANAREALWPGAFVMAQVHFENLADAVVIPATAVQTNADGPFVYMVGPDQKAQMRPVQVGRTTQGQTVVLGGLSGGETVVVEGQFQLEAGAKVSIKNDSTRSPTAGPAASAPPPKT